MDPDRSPNWFVSCCWQYSNAQTSLVGDNTLFQHSLSFNMQYLFEPCYHSSNELDHPKSLIPAYCSKNLLINEKHCDRWGRGERDCTLMLHFPWQHWWAAVRMPTWCQCFDQEFMVFSTIPVRPPPPRPLPFFPDHDNVNSTISFYAINDVFGCEPLICKPFQIWVKQDAGLNARSTVIHSCKIGSLTCRALFLSWDGILCKIYGEPGNTSREWTIGKDNRKGRILTFATSIGPIALIW